MQKDVANLWGNCSEHHLGVVDLFRIKENIAFDVYGWMDGWENHLYQEPKDFRWQKGDLTNKHGATMRI